MLSEVLTTGALTLGLLGSLHCAGMCGPIALLLPVGERKAIGAALYHAGKVSGYAVLGVLAGSVGGGLAWAGAQQWLSVVMGVLILALYVLPRLAGRHLPAQWQQPGSQYLRRAMSRALRYRGIGALWVVGLLNAWLPCGLVYVALAGASVTGNGWEGAAFMALFGLGTAPLLVAVAWIGSLARQKMRRRLQALVPIGVGLMALLMIVRGLNLGIPYLSPAVDSSTQSVRCH